jgi:hypothetical protein
MRNETIFKEGDKVFDILFGWGEVTCIVEFNTNHPVVCRFGEDTINYTKLGCYFKGWSRTLSFTEYKLEGFSQERPEVLPEFGDVVWVRGEFPSQWVIGHFWKKQGNEYYVSDTPDGLEYVAVGIEITTENPYKK